MTEANRKMTKIKLAKIKSILYLYNHIQDYKGITKKSREH